MTEEINENILRYLTKYSELSEIGIYMVNSTKFCLELLTNYFNSK